MWVCAHCVLGVRMCGSPVLCDRFKPGALKFATVVLEQEGVDADHQTIYEAIANACRMDATTVVLDFLNRLFGDQWPMATFVRAVAAIGFAPEQARARDVLAWHYINYHHILCGAENTYKRLVDDERLPSLRFIFGPAETQSERGSVIREMCDRMYKIVKQTHRRITFFT